MSALLEILPRASSSNAGEKLAEALAPAPAPAPARGLPEFVEKFSMSTRRPPPGGLPQSLWRTEG